MNRAESTAQNKPILSTHDKAQAAAAAAFDRKAFNVTVIDVEGRCSYTDMIMIASAGSDRQANAIAESIIESLRKDHGLRPLHREGRGNWVLLDYGDVLIHLFQEDSRAYYDIDKLWSDAPRVAVAEPAPSGVTGSGPSALAQRRTDQN